MRFPKLRPPGILASMTTTGSREAVVSACGDEALAELVRAMRDHNIPPINLPLQTGDGETGGLYQACLLALEAALANLSSADLDFLRVQLPWHLEGEELGEALLQDATSSRYFEFNPSELDSIPIRDRVFRQHPDLKSRLDGDGLIYTAGLDARPSTIFHGGSALHYHSLLRRHFTSHINDSLIQTLLSVERPTNVLRIAIDPEHLMPATEFRASFEKDYWFGPPLSHDALDDRNAIGVTVHGDPKTGLTHEYPRLFVDWRLDKEGRKVVQLEELSEHPSAARGGLRLLRYLHAIRDIENGVFIHCDGAVRAYDDQAYCVRTEKQFVTGRESATYYRKLFRIDGEIATNEWSNIVAQWFRHNTLVTEYLASIEDRSSANGAT
jgi:hypothetical protein